MNKFDLKKMQITEQLADFILDNGLQNSSLRKLGKAINTSDRMLLHYFSDKEDIIKSVLFLLEERLIAILTQSVVSKMNYVDLISFLAKLIDEKSLQPYLSVAIELANSKEKYCVVIAEKVFNKFYEWILSLLTADNEDDIKYKASFIFAVVEGFVLLHKVNSKDKIKNALQFIKKIGHNNS